MEDAAHAGVRRVRARHCSCRPWSAAGRAERHSAVHAVHRNGGGARTPCRRSLPRGAARCRSLARRWVRRYLCRRRHRRQSRTDRLPVRRAHRDLSLRRQGVSRLERLQASERTTWRGQDCRRLHRLSVAWVRVRTRIRPCAGAVH